VIAAVPGRPETRAARSERWILAGCLLLALLVCAWNAALVPPLTGYDEPGHVGYVLTLLREGRLPHPLEGWSTFHPPLYYAVASVVWRLAEPFGPEGLRVGLRAIGIVLTLAAGAAAFVLVRRSGGGLSTAATATLLVLFVPVRQLAVPMIGNEAFAAGLVSLALLPLERLQRDPRDLGAALRAGILTGLALASKFSAVILLAACVVPFARRDLGPRGRRAALAGLLCLGAIAGPIYARNLVLTGSPVPLTRTREPMRSIESGLFLGPRRPSDYLSFSRSVFRHPSVWRAGDAAQGRSIDPEMQRVWNLVYAGCWYDPFAVRVPQARSAEAVGSLLLVAGVVPSLLVAAGFLLATLDLVRRRGRCADAPATVAAWGMLALFVAFTARAPSLAAAKASYLLPAAAPAALFFARGVAALPRRLGAAALVASAGAALLAGFLFTEGVAFRSRSLGPPDIAILRSVAAQLPSSHMIDALGAFGVRRARPGAPPWHKD
jgi:hypothetical protein